MDLASTFKIKAANLVNLAGFSIMTPNSSKIDNIIEFSKARRQARTRSPFKIKVNVKKWR